MFVNVSESNFVSVTLNVVNCSHLHLAGYIADNNIK